MVRFALLNPQSLSEALSMLAEYGQRARIIAGGQTLMVQLKHRQLEPAYLVNVKGLCELSYIRDHNGKLAIGALTVHRDIERSNQISKWCPVMSELESILGCAQTRNWGTIGGNLCDASPATDPPAALIALGAEVKIAGKRGERTMLLEDFIIDQRKTALEPDEMLVEIQVPKKEAYTGGVYYKERVRYTDTPIVGVAAVTTLDAKDVIKFLRIVIQSVRPKPLRAKKAERILEGNKFDQARVAEAAGVAAAESRRTLDLHGGAEIRRELKQELVRVLTQRAIIEAVRRARG